MFLLQLKIAETRVHDVVANVQSVLKEEIAAHSNATHERPFLPDIADFSPTWTMFGNSDDIQDIALIPDIEMVMDQTSSEEDNLKLPYPSTNPPTPQILIQIAPQINLTEDNKVPIEGFWITGAPTSDTPLKIAITENPAEVKTEVSTTESPAVMKTEVTINDKLEMQEEVTKVIGGKLAEEYTTMATGLVTEQVTEMETEKSSEVLVTSTTVPPKLFTWIPDLSTTASAVVSELEEKIPVTTEGTTILVTEKVVEVQPTGSEIGK